MIHIDQMLKICNIFCKIIKWWTSTFRLFVTLKQIVGADIIERFNLFQAAKVSGQPTAGYSSGDALKAIEEVSKEVLPQGYNFLGRNCLSRETNRWKFCSNLSLVLYFYS